MRSLSIWLMGLMMLCTGHIAIAQSVHTKFSCSQVADDGGEKITMGDVGEIELIDNRLNVFHWESAIYRATHGYECSIDEDDGLSRST